MPLGRLIVGLVVLVVVCACGPFGDSTGNNDDAGTASASPVPTGLAPDSEMPVKRQREYLEVARLKISLPQITKTTTPTGGLGPMLRRGNCLKR